MFTGTHRSYFKSLCQICHLGRRMTLACYPKNLILLVENEAIQCFCCFVFVFLKQGKMSIY